MDGASLGPRIAHALRREREAAGLTVSELARRSGISKATVSQLEGGTGNPSVETLWAIAGALRVPFAVFVDEEQPATTLVRAETGAPVPSEIAPYSATLLTAAPPGSRRDVYLIRAEPGGVRDSAPHTHGTTEYVVLMSGAAHVGPADAPVRLAPGDFLTYRGDAAHVFEALETGTTAVLISELR
jgi:transcriptional regulator with XRE-family HTH domain